MTEKSLVRAIELTPTEADISAGLINSTLATLKTFESFDVSGDGVEMVAANELREQQKADFLNDSIRNPLLNICPRFWQERPKRRAGFLELQSLAYARELMGQEGTKSTLEGQMAGALIGLRINEIGFIETAAIIAEGNSSEDERQALIDILKAGGKELNGMPSRELVNTVAGPYQEKMNDVAKETDHPLYHLAKELKEIWQLTVDEHLPVKVLDEEEVQYYYDILADECKEAVSFAFKELGEKNEYTPEEIIAVFDRYLQVRGFSKWGWHAELVKNRTLCAAKQETTTIEVGDKRSAKLRTYQEVLKSMLHEAEVHAGRDSRGRWLGTGLAGLGLANYTAFEEPFAGTVGDVYVGDPKTRAEQHVLAVAISAGYDGTERDFRDSFEVLWRLLTVKNTTDSTSMEEQMANARKSAYSTLTGIWRGMPTDAPGCIYPKNWVYHNGEIMKYLQNGGKLLPREDFLRLLQAKYNPLDTAQDEYIKQLTTKR